LDWRKTKAARMTKDLTTSRPLNGKPFRIDGGLFTPRSRARGCFLTFHRVATSAVWPSLPNRNFYIDIDFLDRLLTYLRRRNWKVVTVDEALELTRNPKADTRFVNFSIDDGYRDNYDLLVPLFRRHEVPITLYLTTGLIDRMMPMWWAGLEDTLLRRDSVVVDGREIDVSTAEAKRQAYSRIESVWSDADSIACYRAFCDQNRVDDDAIYSRHALSWEMVERLRNDPFVEIASHGAMHLRFSSLSDSEAFDALESGRRRLMEKLDIDIRHFAFPYGRSTDCGPRDFELARRVGFASAATSRKGLIRYGQDPFQLPRNTLNGGHKNVALVKLHLAGITGVVARMLGRV
jgi:peptidoglycan/xylan/chitin deacetylase (PgdA/CDA1 family)